MVLEPSMVRLIVLKGKIQLHSSLLQWQGTYKMEMEMEYLMLMITVRIFLTRDVIKKVQQE
jgi:hypothetical protein